MYIGTAQACNPFNTEKVNSCLLGEKPVRAEDITKG